MAGFCSATILLATVALSGYLFTAARSWISRWVRHFCFSTCELPVLGLIPNGLLRRPGEVRSPVEKGYDIVSLSLDVNLEGPISEACNAYVAQ